MIETSSFAAFTSLLSYQEKRLALTKTLGQYKGDWVYVGIFNGIPGLFISESVITEAQNLNSEHLNLDIVNVDLEGVKSGNYIRLSPAKSDFDIGLFSSICDEFIRASDACENATEALIGLVSRWAALLKLVSNSDSANKLVGLFGELICLKQLLTKFGPSALLSWTGPDSARHDFEANDWAIEVKTSTVQAERRAVIHGVGQLDAAPDTTLYLLHLQVEWAHGAETLSDLVADVSALVGESQQTLFYENLKKIGFDRAALARQAAAAIKVNRLSLFPVTASFPRITSKTLIGMQPNITRVDYWLSLEGIDFEDCTSSFAPVLDRVKL